VKLENLKDVMELDLKKNNIQKQLAVLEKDPQIYFNFDVWQLIPANLGNKEAVAIFNREVNTALRKLLERELSDIINKLGALGVAV